jgi:hypothetical protein
MRECYLRVYLMDSGLVVILVEMPDDSVAIRAQA